MSKHKSNKEWIKLVSIKGLIISKYAIKNLEIKGGMGSTGLPSKRTKKRENRSRSNNLFMEINYDYC